MTPKSQASGGRRAPSPDPSALSRRHFIRRCLAGLGIPSLLARSLVVRGSLGPSVLAASGLAPVLAACDGSGTAEVDVGGERARLESRPAAPTAEPVRGLSPLGLGDLKDGLLYVPESYDPGAPAPLFVALHGAGGSARSWESYPGRAAERRFVFLAPESRSLTWDLLRDNRYGPDVEFLDRALAHTFRRVRIDPMRIALAGFSDGASYALSLGRANGDLFTHLVGFSPGLSARPEPLVGRPDVFVSHGTADPVLPFENTRDSVVPALREAGHDVTFREFEGGHEVPGDVSGAALDWFLGTEADAARTPTPPFDRWRIR